MGLFPTLVLLLLPCPALLTPPTGSRPSAARGPPESSETAPIQSPLTPPKPAPDLPSSGKPSQDVKPRAARDAGPSPNCTQQPIRVLISETSIQKDTSGKGEGDGPTLELEPGSPLVLTHRISLVPAPGACGGGCEAQVAALRERVERLEREVSALREKCGDTEGGCCTSQQSTGVHCTMQPGDLCPNDCSDQGRCDQGKCICFPGFSGPDCSSTTCPSNCNNRGTCVNGQCLCETGFTGSDCSENSCPNNCNNKGQCVNGQCVCDSGFMGTDCSAKSCPNNCKNNGKCVNGKCVCNSGFTGTDCSAKSCPSNCSNRGRCVNGQCVCDSGFMGTDCSAKSCPNNCNNNGKCVNGKCVCNSGFTGTDCSAKSCPSNCSNRGRCVNGQCVCDSGFTGADCSAKSCPNNCNNNGKCVNGKCVCDTGFTGTDCSEKSCPNNCNNNGKCVNGKCVCDTGFTGTDCSEKSCPNNCNNNGKCVNGKCVCNSGFTGTDCSAKSCPSNCSNRGRCVNGQCVCNSGFTGADCSAKSCPNNCNNNGKCVNGKCVCNNGFMGTDCSAKSCPNKCRNKGHCVNGQCICNDGFTGPDCSEKSCPNNCSDNGRCIKGKCVCNSGFTGTDCSEKTCPNKCRNKGHCVNGQCICNDGFTGPDCSEKSCPNNCSDNGRCVKGKCVCNSGFTGTDCSKKSCPNNCRNRGRCVNGECVCDSGFTGTDCSEKSCPNNCNNNGRCENGKCVCNSGFTGTDCSAKSCPNHCSDQGRCVDGKCVCNSGFTGPDCSTKSCPSDCSDQGRCVDGKCVCEPGFSGQDCSAKSCPNDCSDKGQCVNGRCVCHHGFTGPDCSQCEEGFTGEDCSTALTGVSQLGTRNITDSSVTMFWTPPSIQYDVYFITFTSKKEGNQKITSKVGGRLTSYTQTGLAAGQEYDVSIRGEKDGKMGAESTTEFMTLISGPKNLRVVKTTTTSVIVQWEPPLADIDRYHLSISASQSEGGEPGRQEMTLPPKRDSAHITGLEAGRLYDITLVSEKGMSQSQPIKVEAIPAARPLPTGKATSLDTDVTVETVTVAVGSEGGVPGKTKPGENVFYKKTEQEDEHNADGMKVWRGHLERDREGDSDRTEADLRPMRTGSANPQDKREDGARPKLPGGPLVAKKTKVPGWAHLNGTRPVQGKAWQRQPGIKRPVFGAKKIIHTAGPKPRQPTLITHGATLQTDAGKRPLEELNVPEVGTDHTLHNSQGRGGNQTPSNQSPVGSESHANPEIGRETGARKEAVKQTTMPRGNIPHININKKVKVGYRRVNGTVWMLGKKPGSEGGARGAGHREGDEAGVGAASGLERGDHAVGSDINITTDMAGSDSRKKGRDDHEPQGEPLVNGRAQGQMQITQTKESSEQQEAKDKQQEAKDKQQTPLSALPTASSPSLLPASRLSEDESQINLPDQTGIANSQEGSKQSLAPPSHTTGPSTPKSQSESDSQVYSRNPEDKGGSLESVSMKTDTGTDPDGPRDSHSANQGLEDKGGSLKNVPMTTGTDTDLDGTADQHSGSLREEDKGGSLETVSLTTKADMTHESAIPNGLMDSSGDEGKNGVEGGGITGREGKEGGPLRPGHPHLRTPPLRRPHIGPFLNRTRPNQGAPRRPNQGGPRPPNQGAPRPPNQGAPRHPNQRVLRPQSQGAPHHPSQGQYHRPRAPNDLHRQQGGYSPENTNSTETRVSPSEPALRNNSSKVKARQQGYSKIGRNITSTQVRPNPNTSPTKWVGFRKAVIYSPVGTGVQKNETDLGGSAPRTGPGFTSIEAQNVTSRGFVLIWEVTSGIYQNFTVIRREYGGKGGTQREKEGERKEEEDEEEDQVVDEGRLGKDQGRTEDGSRSETHFPARPHEKTPKFTQVLPGSARSLLFQDLAPQTNYSLMLSGTGPGFRSKIHQFTVSTGPEPPSDLSFSNVTESSLIVSWAKPKSPVSGFKVTYTHSREGEPISVAVDSKNSTVPLSQLSPGSTYEVSVISLLGLDESDPVKGLVVTLPDPPTDLRAINVSHNKALLLWRPALATVDSYIIVYGSEQAADVRIKVSGNAAEHQLKGLRGATQYSVTVASQLGGQQSAGTSTVFTTVEGTDERGGEGPRKLTANNVTPRSAVLSWKPPSVAVTGYKLTYQTAGEEAKEVTLDPSVTQYKLTRLSPKSKYTVHLRGERRGQYTSPSSTEFTTGTLRFPFPSDCSQELLNGVQESGEAEIFLAGKRGGAVPVYCDMETDGGGWTVFQRRVDGRTNFFRSWKEYSAGFGSLSGEFWLGNELLHNLTSKVPMAMRVDLRVGAELAFAQYSSFSVDTQRRYYAIRVSGYSGTAGDSMAYHDQRPFSTWDRDPNPFITRCSMSYRGGWWYKNCHEANLNGLYDTHTNHQGVIWTSWKGKDFSIPFAEMKIRPASFTPPAQG
ncbi:tenascin-like isoform X2 [Anguilla rostrata]|uniref:tenascin-like isoform X2 n=1 Tax=Anguilla rostrata TaxID=7938 RepID=UPI0030CC2784